MNLHKAKNKGDAITVNAIAKRPHMILNHSAAGAPTGQAAAQAPHSMQVSASITYAASPSDIASTGQSAAQAPQLIHVSASIL
jgi:hypothetical protein